jgi:carbonic anhydrase
VSLAGGARPRRGLAILTCMDARIDPLALLGLAVGDAHVIRNAGGIVDDGTVRSLVISQRKLATREVLILQHTGCSVLGLDDEAFAREIEADAGVRPAWAGGGFTDLEESVRSSVAALRAGRTLPRRDRVRGAIVDLATGEVREVAAGA